MIAFILYVLSGIAASFLSGLLGIGGGIILVPALVFIFNCYPIVSPVSASAVIMHVIIGTSLASSIINLMLSVRAHHYKKTIRWEIVKIMQPALIIGALIIGPILLSVMKGSHLKIIFSLFCLIIAAQIFFSRSAVTVSNNSHDLPNSKILLLSALITGVLSTVLGVSGGAMIGGIFNYLKINIREIVGTASAISLIIALSGTAGLMITGSHQENLLPPYSTGYVYWPAFIGIIISAPVFTPLGARLSHRLEIETLKKLFAGLLAVIGIKMLF